MRIHAIDTGPCKCMQVLQTPCTGIKPPESIKPIQRAFASNEQSCGCFMCQRRSGIHGVSDSWLDFGLFVELLFTSAHMCSCAHVSMCSCAHVSMCSCAHVLMCSCTHVLMCSCAHVLMYSCAHVLMCSCAHVLMCSCAHVSSGSITQTQETNVDKPS
jgi:hypothetical protein